MTDPARPRRARAAVRVALAAACAAALAGCAHPDRPAGEPPLVVLDPGHGPDRPGAVGVRGIPEVEYDDAFVAVLAPRLERAGFRVAVTRRPGEPLDLAARAARARGAWLLLSIHHDSAQPADLVRADRDGRPAFRATRPIRGWSLFVSHDNRSWDASLEIALALGRRLLALGRPPTLHHAEPVPGEGRPLLDARLGVYRYDGLAVLAAAPCAAVLLEVGVLVDEDDEAWVADPARRAAIADAVAHALVDARRR